MTQREVFITTSLKQISTSQLEADGPLRRGQGRVQVLLAGLGHRLLRIHAVDAQALASGQEHALGQAEELGLRRQVEPLRLPGAQVHGRTVQEHRHLVALVEHEVGEAHGVPLHLRIGAGQQHEHLHG